MTVPVVRFTVAGFPEAAPSGLGRPYTVVYDGNCKVCNKLARLLRRWDRGAMLEITTSQTPGVQARFPWIPAQAYMESVQVIGPGGATWQGARALEQLLDILPKGKLISWLFSIPFARPLAERFYRWFARNRTKFGCGEHCAYRAENVKYE
ncbi:MAG: thiol-disulfide oxidoreductase DCC family protein [Thermoanaerobaculia bacterium]